MKNALKVTVLFASIAMTGCSTVMNGGSDSLNVTTNTPANCNVDGQHFIAPGAVSIGRSSNDQMIQCKSFDGYKSGNTTVKSSVTTSAIVGNFFLGGIPGWVVDFATGNAYDYPNSVSVPLKQEGQ